MLDGLFPFYRTAANVKLEGFDSPRTGASVLAQTDGFWRAFTTENDHGRALA
jgi:hypothetical protein